MSLKFNTNGNPYCPDLNDDNFRKTMNLVHASNKINHHCITTRTERCYTECSEYYRKGSGIYKHDNKLSACVKLGQVKLMIGLQRDIDQYMYHYDKLPEIVVYVGSAPGSGLSKVIGMYDSIIFVLFDKVEHSSSFKGLDNVKIHKRFFKDKDALKYAKRDNLLFISDIRCFSEDEEEYVSIQKDMERQRRWVSIIEPNMYSLKFRPPFVQFCGKLGVKVHKYEYLDGKLFYQAFRGPNSTECRLLGTKPKSVKRYDLKKYEGTNFVWNRSIRPSRFRCNVVMTRMLKREMRCYCFDCTTLVSYFWQTEIFDEVLFFYRTCYQSYCYKNKIKFELLNNLLTQRASED